MNSLLCGSLIVLLFGAVVSAYPSIDIKSLENSDGINVIPSPGSDRISSESDDIVPLQFKRMRRSPNPQNQPKQEPKLNLDTPQRPNDGTKLRGDGGHGRSGTDKRMRRSPEPQNQPKLNFDTPQRPYDGTRLNGGGGHGRSGTDIQLQGSQRVWQSDNRNHEVHAQGSYGQHFGGPSGRSPPSYGGGVGYTYHFGK